MSSNHEFNHRNISEMNSSIQKAIKNINNQDIRNRNSEKRQEFTKDVFLKKQFLKSKLNIKNTNNINDQNESTLKYLNNNKFNAGDNKCLINRITSLKNFYNDNISENNLNNSNKSISTIVDKSFQFNQFRENRHNALKQSELDNIGKRSVGDNEILNSNNESLTNKNNDLNNINFNTFSNNINLEEKDKESKTINIKNNESRINHDKENLLESLNLEYDNNDWNNSNISYRSNNTSINNIIRNNMENIGKNNNNSNTEKICLENSYLSKEVSNYSNNEDELINRLEKRIQNRYKENINKSKNTHSDAKYQSSALKKVLNEVNTKDNISNISKDSSINEYTNNYTKYSKALNNIINSNKYTNQKNLNKNNSDLSNTINTIDTNLINDGNEINFSDVKSDIFNLQNKLKNLEKKLDSQSLNSSINSINVSNTKFIKSSKNNIISNKLKSSINSNNDKKINHQEDYKLNISNSIKSISKSFSQNIIKYESLDNNNKIIANNNYDIEAAKTKNEDSSKYNSYFNKYHNNSNLNIDKIDKSKYPSKVVAHKIKNDNFIENKYIKGILNKRSIDYNNSHEDLINKYYYKTLNTKCSTVSNKTKNSKKSNSKQKSSSIYSRNSIHSKDYSKINKEIPTSIVLNSTHLMKNNLKNKMLLLKSKNNNDSSKQEINRCNFNINSKLPSYDTSNNIKNCSVKINNSNSFKSQYILEEKYKKLKLEVSNTKQELRQQKKINLDLNKKLNKSNKKEKAFDLLMGSFKEAEKAVLKLENNYNQCEIIRKEQAKVIKILQKEIKRLNKKQGYGDDKEFNEIIELSNDIKDSDYKVNNNE